MMVEQSAIISTRYGSVGMRHQLRCEHKMHGILDIEIMQGNFEVRCDSRLCGKRPGVVVLHTIDLETGRVETRKFKSPPNPKKRAR